jgi:protein LTV1
MTEDVTKYLADREKWDSDEEGDYEMQETKPKPKWDCETICSTYSNLYNRPKVNTTM